MIGWLTSCASNSQHFYTLLHVFLHIYTFFYIFLHFFRHHFHTFLYIFQQFYEGYFIYIRIRSPANARKVRLAFLRSRVANGLVGGRAFRVAEADERAHERARHWAWEPTFRVAVAGDPTGSGGSAREDPEDPARLERGSRLFG